VDGRYLYDTDLKLEIGDEVLLPAGFSGDWVGRVTALSSASPRVPAFSRLFADLRNIGAPGFEPGTSPTRTVRATRLRHAPTHRQYPTPGRAVIFA
jgi:hypothetical protein